MLIEFLNISWQMFKKMGVNEVIKHNGIINNSLKP